jgi:hypothetical protein
MQPSRPHTVSHLNPARAMVQEKISELRNNPEMFAEFSRNCAAIVRERSLKSLNPRERVIPRPPTVSIEAARSRRREARFQLVMTSPRAFFPGNHEDNLDLRRLVVCLAHGVITMRFSKALLANRFKHRRAVIEGYGVEKFYDFRKSFAEQQPRLESAAIIDRCSLHFSVKRRILVKRRAVALIRPFLVMRRYFVNVTASIRNLRAQVTVCQRTSRQWLKRRNLTIELWRTLWRKFEGEPLDGGDCPPWFASDLHFRPRAEYGVRMPEMTLTSLLTSVWSIRRKRRGEARVSSIELRQLFSLCLSGGETDGSTALQPLPPPSSF